MDEKSGDNGGLVVSKEGDNNLDSGRNWDKKGLEEVKELAREDLSSATTNFFKDKVTENCDVPTTTTTTTEESSQKITMVEHFLNSSNPTK